MTQENRKIIRDILDTENVGYAYMYPMDGGGRKEYMLSLSSENLANCIGTYGLESEKIIVTDMFDRLVVNTQMWFLDTCPDQRFCRELIASLAPIQMGEQEAGNPLAVSREISDEYFWEEEQLVTAAELAMLAAVAIIEVMRFQTD